MSDKKATFCQGAVVESQPNRMVRSFGEKDIDKILCGVTWQKQGDDVISYEGVWKKIPFNVA